MARPPNRRPPDAADGVNHEQAAPSGAVLSRHFGLVDYGVSRWWPAGHVFDIDREAELIAQLKRAGAPFED